MTVEGTGEFPATRCRLEHRHEIPHRNGIPAQRHTSSLPAAIPIFEAAPNGSAPTAGFGSIVATNSNVRIRIGRAALICRKSICPRAPLQIHQSPAQLSRLRQIAESDHHARRSGAPFRDPRSSRPDLDVGQTQDPLGLSKRTNYRRRRRQPISRPRISRPLETRLIFSASSSKKDRFFAGPFSFIATPSASSVYAASAVLRTIDYHEEKTGVQNKSAHKEPRDLSRHSLGDGGVLNKLIWCQ